MAWYAWTDIRHGDGDSVTTIERGSTVSKSDIGDDTMFAQLVESGAVRQMKFPDMPDTYQGSPRDFLLEQAKKAEENADVNVALMMDADEVPTAEDGNDPDAGKKNDGGSGGSNA